MWRHCNDMHVAAAIPSIKSWPLTFLWLHIFETNALYKEHTHDKNHLSITTMFPQSLDSNGKFDQPIGTGTKCPKIYRRHFKRIAFNEDYCILIKEVVKYCSEGSNWH